MKKNLIVIHGGAPTVVLNSSLYGIIAEAKRFPERIAKILGAKNGVQGVLKKDFIDLGNKTNEKIDSLLTSPGTAIGSSRYPLSGSEYEEMVDIFEEQNIGFVFMSGGNGTMGTCGKLSNICDRRSNNIKVIGVPKTMDNDINVTDHAPGYLSAAKYMIQTTREIISDVHSLPIHVCIIEAMGRNAGWVTAATSLSSSNKQMKPDLIYVPERAFNEKNFLLDVKKIYDQKGYAVVVVSEGLKKVDGTPIVPEIFRTGRSVYYGDVGNYLANLVIKKLKIKARNEKPGIASRSSIYLQSSIDRKEAIEVGERGVVEALKGTTGKMVGIFQSFDKNNKYVAKYKMIDIDLVMLKESILPDNFIVKEGNNVSKEFENWLKPMIDKRDYFPIVNFN